MSRRRRLRLILVLGFAGIAAAIGFVLLSNRQRAASAAAFDALSPGTTLEQAGLSMDVTPTNGPMWVAERRYGGWCRVIAVFESDGERPATICHKMQCHYCVDWFNVAGWRDALWTGEIPWRLDSMRSWHGERRAGRR